MSTRAICRVASTSWTVSEGARPVRGRELKQRFRIEVGVGHQAQEPPPGRGRGLKPSAGIAGAVGSNSRPATRGVDEASLPGRALEHGGGELRQGGRANANGGTPTPVSGQRLTPEGNDRRGTEPIPGVRGETGETEVGAGAALCSGIGRQTLVADDHVFADPCVLERTDCALVARLSASMRSRA